MSASQPLLDVGHVREGSDDVIAARGEIDITTAPLLSEALLAAEQRGSGPVIVDLCEVSFMDSSGLHVLLDALTRLARQGRRLSIACVEEGQVHRLLFLADLEGKFSVYPSAQSAVEDREKLSRQLWRP